MSYDSSIQVRLLSITETMQKPQDSIPFEQRNEEVRDVLVKSSIVLGSKTLYHRNVKLR